MKNTIKTGVCLFAIMLSVMLPITVTVVAQSGHGGSTQVIARIEQPSAESSEEPQPEQESPGAPDEKPAKTGDTAFPALFAAASMLCCAAILMLASGNRSKE